MFWAHDYLFSRLTLRHIHDVTSAPLIDYDTYFPMVPPMGHAFMDARVYLNHNFLPWFVFIKDFAETCFPSFSRLSPLNGTRLSAIPFRPPSHFQGTLVITFKTSNSIGLAPALIIPETQGSVRPSSPVINSLM